MSEPDSDDVLTAALIQIAGHAERIAELDSRESSHHAETSKLVASLGGRADALSGRFDAITTILGHHATAINAIDDIDSQVSAIARKLAELVADEASDDGYEPAPAPRWWHLRDAERIAAIDRLRAWVDQVYRPGYGHLSAVLPSCWDHHPLCLYTLDWLSELWSAIYIGQQRTAGILAAQAEWQTRLLPAAAAQMAKDATPCRHSGCRLRSPASGSHREPGNRVNTAGDNDD
jgi:hypothetical protein